MWVNTTSYSKDSDRSKVNTTTIKVDGLHLTVTKYIGMGDELVMHCRTLGIKTKPLGVTDMKEGQNKALNIVKHIAEKIIYAANQAGESK